MMGGRAVRCREESRGEDEREGGGFRLGAGSGRSGASSSACGHVFALPGSRISPPVEQGRRSCRRHLSLRLVHQATVVSRGSGLGAACRPAGAAGANGPADEADFDLIGRARRPQRAGGGIAGGAVWGSRLCPGARAPRWRASPGARRARDQPFLKTPVRAGTVQGCGRGLPNWFDLWFELWGRLPGRPAAANRLNATRDAPNTCGRSGWRGGPKHIVVAPLEPSSCWRAHSFRAGGGQVPCPATRPPVRIPCYEAASVWSLRRPLRGVRRAERHLEELSQDGPDSGRCMPRASPHRAQDTTTTTAFAQTADESLTSSPSTFRPGSCMRRFVRCPQGARCCAACLPASHERRAGGRASGASFDPRQPCAVGPFTTRYHEVSRPFGAVCAPSPSDRSPLARPSRPRPPAPLIPPPSPFCRSGRSPTHHDGEALRRPWSTRSAARRARRSAAARGPAADVGPAGGGRRPCSSP